MEAAGLKALRTTRFDKHLSDAVHHHLAIDLQRTVKFRIAGPFHICATDCVIAITGVLDIEIDGTRVAGDCR